MGGMHTTLEEILVLADQVGLGQVARRVTLPMYQDTNAVWHRGGGSYCAGRMWVSTAPGNPRQDITLKEAQNNATVCPDCAEGILFSERSWAYYNQPWETRAISILGRAQGAQKEAGKVLERLEADQKVAGSRLTRLHNTQKEILALQAGLPATGVDPHAQDVLQESIDQLAAVLEKIRSAGTGGKQREKVLSQARRSLSPYKHDTLTGLDATEVLIGVGIGTLRTRGGFINEILSTFTIYHDKHKRMLVAPRYVYDVLQRQLSMSVLAQTYLNNVPMPEGVSLETIISLWDPTGEGDLVHLVNAVEAARHI